MTDRALRACIVAAFAAACARAPSRPQRPAPDLARLLTTTLDGDPVALAAPGEARLVELWATWCEPCARAAATARPVLARHPRVSAFSVAVDADRDAVAAHAEKSVGEVLLLRGRAAAAARAGFDRFPTFLALDARGRVVGQVTGATPHLGAELDRLLRNAEGRVGERD